MITKEQAKQITLEKLRQFAEEFILNCVEPAIDMQAREGKFHTTPSFQGVPNPEATGKIVVGLLQERGFEAEHVFYDGPNGYDNYILVKWGDE